MIEDDVRTMLMRRAEDITAEPRPWSELEDEPLARESSRTRHWVPVAAAILAVVVAAAVLVARTPSNDADRNTVPVQQVASQVRPFDPASAAPVWPLVDGLLSEGYRDPQFADPAGVTAGYLADRLGSEVVISAAEIDEAAGLARVSWSEGNFGGTVYVRRVGTGADARWIVVGATDADLAFSGLSYTDDALHLGDRLRFTVDGAPAAEEYQALAVSVTVNGTAVSIGDETLPQGGPPDPLAGSLFERPARIDVAMPSKDSVPVVRVQQVGGGFLSVAEFAVQPEGGPPGGRLIARGTLGSSPWSIWGVDDIVGNVDGEVPCIVVDVAPYGRSSDCGSDPGTPDLTYFRVGDVARENDRALVLGMVDAEVDTVSVFPIPDDGTQVRTLPDPAYPAGVRMFAIEVPVSSRPAVVEFNQGDKRLDRAEVRLDGPVGGY